MIITMLLTRSRAVALSTGAVLALMSTGIARADKITLPAGTVISAKLDDTLSSKTSHKGDLFSGRVNEGKDDAGLPIGTRVEGVVMDVQKSVNGKPGYVDVDFRRLVFPGEEMHTINASLYSLDSKSIKRDVDGRLTSSGDRGKDRAKWIGIGAGAGAVISVLTKGSTLQNLIIGAGLGYLFNEYANKPAPGDVDLKPGAAFGVRLNKAFNFNSNRPVSGGYGSNNSKDPYYNGTDSGYTPGYPTPSGNDIGLMVDDKNIQFNSAAPYISRKIVFLPWRTVANATGVKYSMSGSDIVSARNGQFRLNKNSKVYTINGERHRLPSAPENRNGTLYVPMEFVGSVTGYQVSYDADSRTVLVNTK